MSGIGYFYNRSAVTKKQVADIARVVAKEVVVASATPQYYTFSDQNTVTVTHNLGRIPLIQIQGENGAPISCEPTLNTLNEFTFEFFQGTQPVNLSGTIIYF